MKSATEDRPGRRHRRLERYRFELAKIAASKDYDLIIAADEEKINDAAAELRRMGANVDAVVTDLSTVEGVDRLAECIEADGRSVDLHFANAGRGLGKAFSTRILQKSAGSSIRTLSARSI